MTTVNTKMTALAAVEFMLAVAAALAGTFVRFGGDWPQLSDGWALWPRWIAFGVAIVLALTAMGLYQGRQRLTIEGVLSRLLVGLGLAGFGLALIYFVLPPLALWRGWWLLSFGFATLFLVGSRIAFLRLVDQDVFRRRVVIYGAGRAARSLLQLRRRSDQRGFRVVAFLPAPDESDVIDDPRVDTSSGTLSDLACKHDAEEIVIAMDDRRRGFPIGELLACKLRGVDVVDILTFLERESGKVKLDLMNPSWLIFANGFSLGGRTAGLHRALDLVVSIAMLVVTSPVTLLTAIAILIEDGQPIFYRQTRVGMLGREFELLKFRSMAKDAEADGAQWAQRDDPRVTRVGRITRKLRIDELPQLLNIIKGDMRLIGPRPERPEFVKALNAKIPYYHQRHCVKPGLTGWAQLCYPYGSSERDALEKLQFDLYYVKNQSLIFDLMILLQTVEVVLWGKGAR